MWGHLSIQDHPIIGLIGKYNLVHLLQLYYAQLHSCWFILHNLFVHYKNKALRKVFVPKNVIVGGQFSILPYDKVFTYIGHNHLVLLG
jgi:hypothetical protein